MPIPYTQSFSMKLVWIGVACPNPHTSFLSRTLAGWGSTAFAGSSGFLIVQIVISKAFTEHQIRTAYLPLSSQASWPIDHRGSYRVHQFWYRMCFVNFWCLLQMIYLSKSLCFCLLLLFLTGKYHVISSYYFYERICCFYCIVRILHLYMIQCAVWIIRQSSQRWKYKPVDHKR